MNLNEVKLMHETKKRQFNGNYLTVVILTYHGATIDFCLQIKS